MKAKVLGTVLIVTALIVSCNGGDAMVTPTPNGASEGPPVSDVIEPVSARVIVTGLSLSADGKSVESITVRTEDEMERVLRLGTDINPTTWGPAHINGHMETGKAFGFTIGVNYVETSEGTVAIGLFE